jgi:hypothetical protein
MRPVQFLVAGRKPRAAMQTEGIGSAGHVGWRLGSYDALSKQGGRRCTRCAAHPVRRRKCSLAALCARLRRLLLAYREQCWPAHTRARASGCAKRTNSRQPRLMAQGRIIERLTGIHHARHTGRLKQSAPYHSAGGLGGQAMLDWGRLGLLPTQLYHHRRRSEASGQGRTVNIPQTCARRLFSIAVAEGAPELMGPSSPRSSCSEQRRVMQLYRVGLGHQQEILPAQQANVYGRK